MSVGSYCKLEVVVGGSSLAEHRIPGQADPYVEAVYGSPYTIRVRNLSLEQIAVEIYVDGTRVGSARLVSPRGWYDLSDVLTRSEVRAGDTYDYYDKIVFAAPQVLEEQGVKGAVPAVGKLR